MCNLTLIIHKPEGTRVSSLTYSNASVETVTITNLKSSSGIALTTEESLKKET